VATAEDPDEAVQVASDRRPNVIVVDPPVADGSCGADLVGAFKSEPATQDIPVVVLSGRPLGGLSPSTRQADLLVEIPIRPDDLLERIKPLLVRVAEVRRRSDESCAAGRRLMAKSDKLLRKSQDLADKLAATTRACPDCSAQLEWIERGTIGASNTTFTGGAGTGAASTASTGPATDGCG
jgi:response regulator RpfG family c-di-GMP phosphodiesterase